MAIDFPNSPTLNQEFTVGDRVWFWNGTAWKAKETAILETGKYIVSETAPANPEEGDGWFDSVNTREFIYYDNFWVETSAAAVGLPAANYATEEYVDNAVGAIDLTGYATETYVGNQIANLVDSAPSTLDTLNELAAALADDPSFATTITNELANKASTVHTHAISDVTNLQTNLDAKSTKVKNIVNLTTSRAITDTDSDSLLVSSSSSNINLTIPLDQDNDLANGFRLEVSKIGNGNISIFPGSGTQSWTSFTGAAYGVHGIESNTDGSTTIVVTGTSTTKTIYRTTNAGTTWASIGTITATNPSSITNRRVAYSSGKFIIAANGSAHISDNDGLTFTQYSSGLTASDVFVAGAISTDGNTIILIKETATDNIAISTNAGTTFSYSTITLPTSHVPGDIIYSATRSAFYLQTKGSIGVTSNNLYKSSNGSSWSLVGSATLSSNTSRSILGEKDGIIFVRVGTNIHVSTDGETLVIKKAIGTGSGVTQSYWLDSTFYVRLGSAVYSSSDNGETWDVSSSLPVTTTTIFISSSETLIMAGTTGSSTYYKTGSITVSLNGGYSAINLETAEESIGLVKIGDDSWITSAIPAESTSFASTVEDHNLLALIGAI